MTNDLESNHKVSPKPPIVSKPPVVDKQDDLENDLPYSIPVQETGGRGSGSQVGVVYAKNGAKLTTNTAKPVMNAAKPGKEI